MTSARPQRGFTLLEVLVALAIVTVGMAALLSALSSSADSATYLRDKTFAEWVALNRIEEVRLALQRPQKGKTNGEAELAGRKWKWQQEILETQVKGILRIDVSVKPAEVAGDGNWYTTVSGISGDALAQPRGSIDYFARVPQPGPGGGPNGPNGPNGPGGPNSPNGPNGPNTPRPPQNGDGQNTPGGESGGGTTPEPTE
jgi:general secretion pathway protein I